MVELLLLELEPTPPREVVDGAARRSMLKKSSKIVCIFCAVAAIVDDSD